MSFDDELRALAGETVYEGLRAGLALPHELERERDLRAQAERERDVAQIERDFAAGLILEHMDRRAERSREERGPMRRHLRAVGDD
jgi:hypothetical protein